jgi:hypothetical protein
MENSKSKYTALSGNTLPNKDIMSFVAEYAKDTSFSILDWGAGKGRHTKALRSLGYKVWSYDPYNGKDTEDGYNNVSSRLPTEKHDLVFSSYVLNVIHECDLDKNIKVMESFTKSNGIICHKVREDSELINKTVKAKCKSVLGKRGSIQRLILQTDLSDYKRDKKRKIYFKKIERKK